MSTHESLTPVTRELEDAIHAALDACDTYREAVDREIEKSLAEDAPNEMVLKRLRQFHKRIDSITQQLEDGILDDLNFLTDRLFAVKLAEDDTFI